MMLQKKFVHNTKYERIKTRSINVKRFFFRYDYI
jgi:hypothetical protein